jgi:hypothetical protein
LAINIFKGIFCIWRLIFSNKKILFEKKIGGNAKGKLFWSFPFHHFQTKILFEKIIGQCERKTPKIVFLSNEKIFTFKEKFCLKKIIGQCERKSPKIVFLSNGKNFTFKEKFCLKMMERKSPK